MLKFVNLIYYSPTYSTKKIVQTIASGINLKVKERDITTAQVIKTSFTKEDVVVFGVPVYGGRVPEHAVTHIKKFTGNNARAVAVVVYGNRDYDDALLELTDICKEQGFRVLGAGAFIAQHTFTNEIGTGRPDADDLAVAKEFGVQIRKKLNAPFEEKELPVKGNRPYKAIVPSTVTSHATSACTSCGNCVKPCPTAAITPSNPRDTIVDRCIRCGRCIQICPEKARYFPAEFLTAIYAYLAPSKEPKKPEWFI